MDADRFDHLSRSFAARTTRRRALFAGSGFLAALGLSRAAARAQDDTTTCTLDLVAGIRLGPTFDNRPQPDQPFEIRGQLRFGIGEQGRLVDGKLRMADDTEYDAVGQVAGHAITIRIAAGPDRTIVLVGAGENALRSCNGDVDGLLTGPEVGDLGDWHAVATKIGTEPSTAQPTAASGAILATQPSGSNPAQPTQPQPPPTEAPTATTAAPCLADGTMCGPDLCPSCCNTFLTDAQQCCTRWGSPCDVASSVCCVGICDPVTLTCCVGEGERCSFNCCSGLTCDAYERCVPDVPATATVPVSCLEYGSLCDPGPNANCCSPWECQDSVLEFPVCK